MYDENKSLIVCRMISGTVGSFREIVHARTSIYPNKAEIKMVFNIYKSYFVRLYC